MKVSESARRPYRQRSRAEQAAANTQAIVEAAEALFSEHLYDQVTLADVAARAGVGLQTLIRRFPTKPDLVAGVGEVVRKQIRAQREAAPVGDVEGIVINLAEHYEERGDRVLKLLAQEERIEPFRRATEAGRQLHREWTEMVFAPQLASAPDRELRTVQLLALCDVYVWKVMCRDQGLTRRQYELALREMINRLLQGEP